MHKLKVTHDTCNCNKECALCEKYLPGFLSEHNGDLLISPTNLAANMSAITTAIKACPTRAIVLK